MRSRETEYTISAENCSGRQKHAWSQNAEDMKSRLRLEEQSESHTTPSKAEKTLLYPSLQ